MVKVNASLGKKETDTIPNTLLSLGDSYTIGESVAAVERFPFQTVDLLHRLGYAFEIPVIIAKTGWTTQDLLEAIDKRHLSRTFDRVTLLIGVNDQYQGYDTAYYRLQFKKLLLQKQYRKSKANEIKMTVAGAALRRLRYQHSTLSARDLPV